jgi:gas vesicle protein
MNDNAKTIAAALAGLAIGAVAGILFAPEKGSQIRNKLAHLRGSRVIEDPSEEIYHHEDSQIEATKKARLKRPAIEKLKETKDKITASAPHLASGLTDN